MMQMIRTGTLHDGRRVEILRFRPSGQTCDLDFRRYFLGSFAWNEVNPGADLGVWLADLTARISGSYRTECEDFFYAAKVEGTFAARLWFGFSRRNGLGNFGHVCTEPEFRKKGLLNLMMKCFVQDFAASGAKMVGCGVGNPIALHCYAAHGFQLPYKGDKGPMFFGEDFLNWAKNAFSGSSGIKTIRPGTAGDQFGCDKFLRNSPAVFGNPECRLSLFPDFRTALVEQRAGSTVVCVAENDRDIPVGFAFIRRCGPSSLMDYLIHPDWAGETDRLLKETERVFAEKFPDAAAPGCVRKC